MNKADGWNPKANKTNIHVLVSMKLTHACEIIKDYKIHICWIGQAFLLPANI